MCVGLFYDPRRAQRELTDLEGQVAQAEAARAAVDVHSAALTDADRALGRNGIPSLILEDVLSQLQAYTARFLNELCDGFVLELSATKPPAAGAGGGGSSGRRSGVGASREKEEIHKAVKVRNSADGSLRQRDVRQLSGGERRRTALAMCLGFEELVRRRRRLVCNVMVLDEVMYADGQEWQAYCIALLSFRRALIDQSLKWLHKSICAHRCLDSLRFPYPQHDLPDLCPEGWAVFGLHGS
ncbi:hypothetical protein Vafri_3488 [Volvox africanus]|uniref:ABC transporter domain-containing protein n=1 Tax=Volvox africanus TaxID=51714 RepID=A0A8J4AV02_9CHLO|nr:hypothetical protein Vafri_3488 [Volvox africanus]